MDKTQNPVKILNKFSDVINLNALVATRPEKVKLIYKTSESTGLWQLDLLSEDGDLWTIGHYVDGLEDRFVYDVTATRRYRDYVVEGFDELRVLWMAGGFIFVTLPNESAKRITIAAPQVCHRTDPLREPVYIWRDSSTRHIYVLDCGGGLRKFAQEKFEEWVKRFEHTIHWQDSIYWQEWYVIPGVITGNEEWITTVMSSIRGPAYPAPYEVLTLVFELLHP